MNKIAAEQKLSSTDRAKIATRGFATLAGSPSSGLDRQAAKALTGKFKSRVDQQLSRHGKIRNVMLEHAKG